MKEFNTTGLCIPEKHYMCDVTQKFNRCKLLINKGKYFAINFPRQYGKTTMQYLLTKEFQKKEDYLVLSISFEGIGDTVFQSEEKLSSAVLELFAEILEFTFPEISQYIENESQNIFTFKSFGRFISKWISSVGKKVILIIDEIDKASNNQVFLSFLAMFRNRYLQAKITPYSIFHSIILLGVHDVKSLKLKLRPEDEKKLNSPWNISENLNIEFTFSIKEIEPMIKDYAAEHNFEMDISGISKKIHYYTNGNPFLISQMCKIIDEIFMPDEKRAWTIDDIEQSYFHLINGAYTTTNFDDVDKNLENNKDLYNLVHNIVIQGNSYSFYLGDPVIAKGKTYGILLPNSNGRCDISNKIYEFRIIDYMLSKQKTNESSLNLYHTSKFIENGELNILLILQRFQLFLKEHNSSKDNKFLEKNGRLLLMSFLRPIINGKGFLFKENVTAEDRKMDLVITFNNKRYVIELKIWYGEKYLSDGIQQLCDYLDSYSLDTGFILIYNFNKNKKYETKVVPDIDKKITAVFV